MVKKQQQSDAKPKIFKRYRGGIELTKAEIAYIKAERKKLRKQLKASGIKSKREFEMTASSLGLYFDKRKGFLFLWWFDGGRALWALIGAFIAFLAILYLFSVVTQMRGHFTINLSQDLFRNGFVLSETEDFANPTVQLLSDPVEDAPNISFASIPEDVDAYEGMYDDRRFFAYTFFLRNEGEDTVDYHYELSINSETQELSEAAWIMLFEDGQMKFFAEQKSDGKAEVIPDYTINDRGYPDPVLLNQAADASQFELMGTIGNRNYYRIVPINFESETIVESNMRYGIKPFEIHKYTVVIWLEGDDPECTNEKIGGHLGLEMNFQLIDEVDSDKEKSVWEQIRDTLDDLADSLRFWES